SRRRHTRSYGDWSSDVCSSDLFVANLSDFDRRARVCLTDATTTVDTHLYLDYVTAQVMAWTPEEIRVLAHIIEDIDARLSSRWRSEERRVGKECGARWSAEHVE